MNTSDLQAALDTWKAVECAKRGIPAHTLASDAELLVGGAKKHMTEACGGLPDFWKVTAAWVADTYPAGWPATANRQEKAAILDEFDADGTPDNWPEPNAWVAVREALHDAVNGMAVTHRQTVQRARSAGTAPKARSVSPGERAALIQDAANRIKHDGVSDREAATLATKAHNRKPGARQVRPETLRGWLKRGK